MFIDQLDLVLEATGMATDALCLEITESVLSSGDLVLQQIQAVQERGVALSLDDFGTGYSSLTQLQSFRLHHLKLDRSFITDLDQRPASQAIVRAVLAMADALQLTTVAEGVERVEELALLTQMGVDRIQGYLFSPPLDGNAMASALQQRGCGGSLWPPDQGRALAQELAL